MQGCTYCKVQQYIHFYNVSNQGRLMAFGTKEDYRID